MPPSTTPLLLQFHIPYNLSRHSAEQLLPRHPAYDRTLFELPCSDYYKGAFHFPHGSYPKPCLVPPFAIPTQEGA